MQQAGGKVRCGECNKVFAAVTGTAKNQEAKPQPAASSSRAASDTSHAPSDTPVSTSPQDGLFIDPPLSSLDSGLTIPDVHTEDLSANLPVAYTGPPIKPRRRLSPGSPSAVIALCLLLLFFSQYLRAHRQELAVYPSMQPPLKMLCALTGCKIQPQRDVDKIELLSHGIYSHPTIENALMIKATMVNHADFEQDYPFVQISLGNISGHTVALRRFSANEYLDRQQPLPEKMPIEKTIPIRIEVIDPGKNALAFEFKFL